MAKPLYNPSGATAGTFIKFLVGTLAFTAVMVVLTLSTNDSATRVIGVVVSILGAALALAAVLAIAKLRRMR